MYKLYGEVKVYRKYQGRLGSPTDSKRKGLTEMKIKRGILQGDELSPLLFVTEMTPFNL